VELRLGSSADSCAFFVDDELKLHTCSGVIQLDLRRYYPYELTFYSTQPNRCDDTSHVAIEVRTPPILGLPNAFTPNGDGINDTWPGLIDLPELGYEVQLFDRWGHSLWASADTQEKWDGAALPDGVYVYMLHMKDPCDPNKKLEKNGFVTLLR
jgi:gliding motility-associated-like protein